MPTISRAQSEEASRRLVVLGMLRLVAVAGGLTSSAATRPGELAAADVQASGTLTVRSSRLAVSCSTAAGAPSMRSLATGRVGGAGASAPARRPGPSTLRRDDCSPARVSGSCSSARPGVATGGGRSRTTDGSTTTSGIGTWARSCAGTSTSSVGTAVSSSGSHERTRLLTSVSRSTWPGGWTGEDMIASWAT